MPYSQLALSAKEKSLRAFSLVELLLALAILGGLFAYSLPYYLQAQTKAKALELHLRLAQISSALERYYTYYQAFPPCLDTPDPLNVEQHFSELIAMLLAEHTDGSPLSKEEATLLNPQRRSFLHLSPQDYNLTKTSFRTLESTSTPLYLQVRQGLAPLHLPHPLEGNTTPHRVIVYTYSQDTLIGSWSQVD